MELTASIPLSTIKKIELYQNLSRLPMATIKARTGADYIINGGIYSFKTFKPFGNVKIDGKVIYNPGYGEYGFAWNSGADIAYEKLPSNRNSCYEMTFFNRKSQRTFTCQIVQNTKRHL